MPDPVANSYSVTTELEMVKYSICQRKIPTPQIDHQHNTTKPCEALSPRTSGTTSKGTSQEVDRRMRVCVRAEICLYVLCMHAYMSERLREWMNG